MRRRLISFATVAIIAACGCETSDNSDGGTTEPEAGPDLPTRDLISPDKTPPDTVRPDAELPRPLKWVNVAAGTFSMGSPTTEPCREQKEEPETQHQVTLTRKFEILSTEVTQAQFKAEMGYNPSGFTGGSLNRPVETVTWHEAITYCNALSAKKKLTACYTCSGSGKKATCSVKAAYASSKIYTCPGYRLPTEAEWEYAYRAGTTTAYYSGALRAPLRPPAIETGPGTPWPPGSACRSWPCPRSRRPRGGLRCYTRPRRRSRRPTGRPCG